MRAEEFEQTMYTQLTLIGVQVAFEYSKFSHV